MFENGINDSAIAYIIYSISAYITVAATIRIVKLAKRIGILMHKNWTVHKYLTQEDFRADISLYLSLIINLSYALYKAVLG